MFNKNQINKFSKILFSSSIAATLVAGCVKPNDPKPDAPLPKPGASGFYVVNEGQFNKKNASISFFDKATNSATINYYQKQTGKELGDQAQSMTIYNGKGYIVVQNSQKVEVVDMTVFTSQGALKIPSTSSPRYFIGASENIGYLSDWGSDKVLAINLTDQTITQSITVGKGPDFMVKSGNKICVANSGGYGNDNSISVINTLNNAVEATIMVGDSPNSMVLDKDNNLWVLCSGQKVYGGAPNYDFDAIKSTNGSLIKINLSNNAIVLNLKFGSLESIPKRLTINALGTNLYYTLGAYGGTLYTHDIAATTLNINPILARNFYGLAFDPSANQLIGCVAPSFTSNGKIIRYNLVNNAQVAAVDSFEVGVNPSSVVFK